MAISHGHLIGEVEVDSRRRVSLGRAARHSRYRVEEDEQGVLTLTPLVSVPITVLTDDIRRALAAADAGELFDRPASSPDPSVQHSVG